MLTEQQNKESVSGVNPETQMVDVVARQIQQEDYTPTPEEAKEFFQNRQSYKEE